MRAALYARFSTDLQRQASIHDQLVACRAFCAKGGLRVVAEFQDAAISGASTANRPGLNDLMRAAERGEFDVLVSEALDRLSRSQGDVATLYEDLRGIGIAIRTISEGDVEEMAIGLKGTMNAMQLRETGRKTRRGLVGVAKEGRHAGGRVYGYRIRREFDAKGEMIPGLRDIEESEAAVVRQVFRDYADGLSPRAIAAKLNALGHKSPRGGVWNASTINGNAERGNGLLHNQLYRGQLVWGRHAWIKSRRFGTRRSKPGDPAEIVHTEVPHLRIVSDALWSKVRARYAGVALGPNKRPEQSRRPRRLLSGLTRCGVCGGPLIIGGAEGRLVCSVRRERGPTACTNGRSVKSAEIEERVVAAIREVLLEPAVIEEAMREFHAASSRRKAGAKSERVQIETELAEVKRRAARLVDQVAEGVLSGAAVKDKLAELEAKRTELERRQSAAPAADVVELHPSAPKRFRALVERLAEALNDASGVNAVAARNELRGLIRSVRVTPLPDRGEFEVTVETEMAALVSQDGHISTVGAGTRTARSDTFSLPLRLTA